MLKILSDHLFAGRELGLAVLELRSHRLLVVTQLAAPAQQKLSPGLSWSLNRPDGRDEGGEVVVAPAVASLGAVIIESTQAETWQHHGQL